ncbi:hypothetical protein K227x_59110 [Rubripirellula lacrimiformis]|uniref:Uncharacterized protein n=1 Tax=Rubripirellula lacrimiformis TaxID=1930273 RepID=A0A517NK21_9BACT|nr:hypothetical protein K227x_59110 [Rubripirellula lacrimiformis]
MNRADFKFIAAIRSGCLVDFNEAVDRGASPSSRSWDGTPSLVVASKARRPDYARRLIELGADPNQIKDKRGDTLLFRAARIGPPASGSLKRRQIDQCRPHAAAEKAAPAPIDNASAQEDHKILWFN